MTNIKYVDSDWQEFIKRRFDCFSFEDDGSDYFEIVNR